MREGNNGFMGITYSDSPCWCELLYAGNDYPALIFRLHEDFIKSIDFDLRNSAVVKDLKSELNLPEFMSDFNNDFGFNGVFKHIVKKDGFVEFLIKIPKIRFFVDEKCGICSGSKQDSSTGLECSFCEGTGRKLCQDWSTAFNISATFSAITPLIKFYKRGSSAPFNQLLTFFTITRKGLQGGSLSGEIGSSIRHWLDHENKVGDEIPEIISTMKTAYEVMLGSSQRYSRSFRFVVRENGRFVAECPIIGTCSVYPYSWEADIREIGYKFSSSNSDDPARQIVMLVALATLSGMVKMSNSSKKTN